MKRLNRLRDTASALMFTLAVPAVLAMALLKDGVSRATIEFEFPALKQARGKLTAKREALGAIFDEAGPDVDLAKVKSIDGDNAAKAAAIRALNDELTALGKEVDDLCDVARAAKAVKDGEAEGEHTDDQADEGRGGRTKSFGESFVAAKAHQTKQREIELPDFDVTVSIIPNLKTLLDTATGWVPETTRGPRLVDLATRPIQVANLIPQTTTGETAVTYMEETTFTNAAAETAEGAAKPEATLALTEKSSPVRKIAVFLPVTDEQLEDVPRIRAYLDNRLPFMVRQRLDAQIINGDGTAPNLRGMLNVVGIQTQAKGADPTPDAIHKAIVKVNVTGQGMANLVIMHPNDWQDVRLLRTADGIYIWGNPSDAGPERIWGLTVSMAQAAVENTGIVADTNFMELAIRKGMVVETSNSHGEFFRENKQAIRAEMRAAFVVYRPAAICKVTGI